MKYKLALTEKTDASLLLLESTIKGLENNTISKEELTIKLKQVLSNVKQVANTISIEQDDFQ